MTLHDYLQSEQAREDVRRVVTRPDDALRYSGGDGPWLIRTTLKAWTRIEVEFEDSRLTAYYRPDGDRYIVTDLGEGVRAYELRSGSLYFSAGTIAALNAACQRMKGPGYRIETETTDLPDAICRVMLASLKVSEVAP